MVVEFEAFKQPTLQAFIKNAPVEKNYRLAKSYPVEEVAEIEAVYDVIDSQPIVAGSIVGFDAGTPVRTKGGATQMMAKLTKIAHAYKLTDSEMLKFRNPRTASEQLSIVNSVLMNTKDLSDGIEDIKEYIRASLTYRGMFEYKDEIGNVQLSFELDRDSANDIKVSALWSNPATAKPLDDLDIAVQQFKDSNNGRTPDYIVMTSKTYSMFKRTEQVKAEVNGDLKSRIVKDTDISELLTSLSLPVIEIDDNTTNFEKKDGSIEVKKNLEDGKVVLHSAIMGTTLSGPSVENNYNSGKFAYSVVTMDPPGEKTIVGEVVMPVNKNVNGSVVLSVL